MSSWPLRRAYFFYNDINNPMSSDLRTRILATNPEFSDSGTASDLTYFYNNKNGFYVLQYKSITDNYVFQDGDGSPGTHTWLAANAAAFGTDIEACYLHFINDTYCSLLNRNTGTRVDVLVKGYGGPEGTATTLSEARVPCYYHTQSRCLTNFSTPEARLLWIKYFVENNFTVPFDGVNYPGGMWLDNGAYALVNMDLSASQTKVGFGLIREHPTNAKINTTPFYDWYFDSSFGLFVKQLKEYVDSFPPVLGSRIYKIALNVATQKTTEDPKWVEKYVDFAPAHMIVPEFFHNPAYFSGLDFSYNSYVNQKKASDKGIIVWETGYQYSIAENSTVMNTGYGTYTVAEAIISTCAEHWLMRSENSVIIGYPHSWVPTGENGRHDWEFFNLKPIWSIDLGRPKYKPDGPWCIFDGQDPVTNSARVYCREFDNGLVLSRRRGSNTEGVYTNTAVTVTLPFGSWKQVTDMDGTLSSSLATTASIRSGQALMFKRV